MNEAYERAKKHPLVIIGSVIAATAVVVGPATWHLRGWTDGLEGKKDHHATAPAPIPISVQVTPAPAPTPPAPAPAAPVQPIVVVAGAEPKGELCGQRLFIVPAALWATGKTIDYSCEYATYSLGVIWTTPPKRKLRFLVRPNHGATIEATFVCDTDVATLLHAGGIYDRALIDCTAPDVVKVDWPLPRF